MNAFLDIFDKLKYSVVNAIQGIGKNNNNEWCADAISDPWFSAHFHYAANVVSEWIGSNNLSQSRILDFGCGDGITALALILRYHAANVIGVDISATHRGLGRLAKRELGLRALPAQLAFKKIKPGKNFRLNNKVDFVVSWSTFEHVDLVDLDNIFANLFNQLCDEGQFFLQINPLYYSPYGSHLGRFMLEPWAHLQHSLTEITNTVMEFSGVIPADEMEENFYTRDIVAYKNFVLSEYIKLNKLTVKELKQRLIKSGFEIVRELHGKVSLVPPDSLVEKFGYDDLVTDEVRLLLRKSRS